MMRKTRLIFEELDNKAKEDSNIIGFFLGGSRGKGIGKKHSDYDVYIIVKDNVVEKYKKKFPFRKFKGLDLIIFSYSEFIKYCIKANI